MEDNAIPADLDSPETLWLLRKSLSHEKQSATTTEYLKDYLNQQLLLPKVEEFYLLRGKRK